MLPWHDAQRWARLCAGMDCPLCVRPLADVAWTLGSGLVRVPRVACLPGYACVVYRQHVVELHDLADAEAMAFLADVRRTALAVQRLTGAVKINLLSLGNLVPHLHMHICPRQPGDRFEGRALDPGDVQASAYQADEHARFVAALSAALA